MNVELTVKTPTPRPSPTNFAKAKLPLFEFQYPQADIGGERAFQASPLPSGERDRVRGHFALKSLGRCYKTGTARPFGDLINYADVCARGRARAADINGHTRSTPVPQSKFVCISKGSACRASNAALALSTAGMCAKAQFPSASTGTRSEWPRSVNS